MLNILNYIPNNAKLSPKGWYSFNCPACTHRGQSRDTRKRGGLMVTNTEWVYHCFNCNFKTKMVFGTSISNTARNLLSWLGVSDVEINKLVLDNLRSNPVAYLTQHKEEKEKQNKFDIIKLPSTARKLTQHDKKYITYLESRKVTLDNYNFYITPNDNGRNKNRILIPYYHENNVVGWTSRYLDDKKPKYLNEHQQTGFVFNLHNQPTNWNYIIVAEGVFDAICINGVAVMHNDITPEQSTALTQSGKEIIVVPDQDKAGLNLINRAVDLKYSVSIPEWEKGIHDINEAVCKYGKLATIINILDAKENNKIKIHMNVSKLRRKI